MLNSPSLCFSWSSSPLMPGPAGPPLPLLSPSSCTWISSSFLMAASSSIFTSIRTASSWAGRKSAMTGLEAGPGPGPPWPSQYFSSLSHWNISQSGLWLSLLPDIKHSEFYSHIWFPRAEIVAEFVELGLETSGPHSQTLVGREEHSATSKQ